MIVYFHPEAVSELEESVKWYSKHSESTAQRFVLAVESTILKIIADPDRFPRVLKQFQACSVSGFPFQIVFRCQGQSIDVLAFAHSKRRPLYWSDRS